MSKKKTIQLATYTLLVGAAALTFALPETLTVPATKASR